jgi:hypothetical protein
MTSTPPSFINGQLLAGSQLLQRSVSIIEEELV